MFAAGLGGQLHIQVVLQVVSFSLHSGQRRGGLQSVLRRADIMRDGESPRRLHGWPHDAIYLTCTGGRQCGRGGPQSLLLDVQPV